MNKEEFLSMIPWATLIKAGTKKAELLELEYARAQRNHYISLHDVYGSCSSEKLDSFAKICNRAWEQSKSVVYISGYNSMQYSCMYTGILDNNIPFMVKDTAHNTYVIIYE